MTFKDYESFSDPIRLPIGGKTYTIPECPAALGLQIVAVRGPDDESPLSKMDMGELGKALLGPVWDEMLADGVPFPAINRVALVAVIDVQLGRQAAEAAWEAGTSPESLAAAMAAKMTAAMETAGSVDLTLSPSTGEANTTPPQASSSGTTSPRTTRPTGGKKAKAPKV